MKSMLNPMNIVAAMVYSALGMALLAAAFVIVDKCTPYELWNEIVQKQNRALAVIVGSITIGISIIIAAAMIG